MIPNDQPLRSQTIKRMLNHIADDPANDLTAWEFDFIHSIQEQFDKKGDLTTRQCEILERIHDR